MAQHSVDFGNPDTAKAFKAAYDRALANNVESFTFEGNEVLVDYAYYMLEYAADQLKQERLRPVRRKK